MQHLLPDTAYDGRLRIIRSPILGINKNYHFLIKNGFHWYIDFFYFFLIPQFQEQLKDLIMTEKTTREELGKKTRTLEQASGEINRTEKRLHDSEDQYRALFETMTLGVVYQDMEGHIISTNPAAQRILGLSQDQILGRTSLDPRWHAIREDGSEFQGETHPSMIALRTGEEVKNVVMGVFHPLIEEYRWINIHAVPQFKPGEKVPYQVYTTFDDITERKDAEIALRSKDKKLEQQTKNLEEMNTALKVLLEQREIEKTEIKETLQANAKKLIYPYIEKLENSSLNEDAQTFVNIIKSNMNDLILPYASTISSKYFSLTPAEIQIADLIKEGKTSKEIASMLNVSAKAVSFHRGNLRRKLGLSNKKINLKAYLQTFPH